MIECGSTPNTKQDACRAAGAGLTGAPAGCRMQGFSGFRIPLPEVAMMLPRTVPLTLVILGFAACSAGESDAPSETGSEEAETATAEPTVSADVQAIDALREDWVTHYNLLHPDMVADFYAPEALVLHADQVVVEGREAVAGWLTESMADDPTVTITTRETLVFGDHGVTLGDYQVERTTPEGESLAVSGHYLNLVTRLDGEWLIEGSITNYDSPRPEDWAWGEPADELPPEEGTMTELVEAYETHWNLQHPDMVADLYTEDALATFADGPLLEGRASIEARLEEALADGATLDVHDVGTVDLDEDHRVDGGWYEITAGEGGDVVQTGLYMLLAERQDDGGWAIRWSVTNGRPMAGPME